MAEEKTSDQAPEESAQGPKAAAAPPKAVAGLGPAVNLFNLLLVGAGAALWQAAVVLGRSMVLDRALILLLAGLAPLLLFGVLQSLVYAKRGVKTPRQSLFGCLPDRGAGVLWLLAVLYLAWLALQALDIVLFRGRYRALMSFPEVYPPYLWFFYFSLVFTPLKGLADALTDWLPQDGAVRRVAVGALDLALALVGGYVVFALGLEVLNKLGAYEIELAQIVFLGLLVPQLWSWLNRVVAAFLKARSGLKKAHTAMRLISTPIVIAVVIVKIVVFLGGISVVQQLELFTIDSRFEARGPIPPFQGYPPGSLDRVFFYEDDSGKRERLSGFWAIRSAMKEGKRIRAERGDEKITVVAIDDLTQDQTYQIWPFPRAWHGQLIRNLSSMGAKVIDFDVFFVEKDLKHPGTDRRFAEAILSVARTEENPDGAHVILGTAIDEFTLEGQTMKRILKPNDYMLGYIGVNTDPYADWGVVNQPLDPDGAARQSSLGFYVEEFEMSLPSYSMTAVSRYLDTEPNLNAQNYFNKFHSLTASEADRGFIELCDFREDAELLNRIKSLDEMWDEAVAGGLGDALSDADADEYKDFIRFLTRYTARMNQAADYYLRLTSLLRNMPHEVGGALPEAVVAKRTEDERKHRGDYWFDLGGRRGGPRDGGWEVQWLGRNLMFTVGGRQIPVDRRDYLVGKCSHSIPVASGGGTIAEAVASAQDRYDEQSRDIRLMTNFYGYPYKFDTFPYLYYLIVNLEPEVLLNPAANMEGYPLNALEFHKLQDLRDEIYIALSEREGPPPLEAIPADMVEIGSMTFMSMFGWAGSGQLAVFRGEEYSEPEIVDVGGLLTAMAYDEANGLLYVMSGVDGAVLRFVPEDLSVDIQPFLFPVDIEEDIQAGFQELWSSDAGPAELLQQSRLFVGAAPADAPVPAAESDDEPGDEPGVPVVEDPFHAAPAVGWVEQGYEPGEGLLVMYHPGLRGIIVRGLATGTKRPVIRLPVEAPLKGLEYDGAGRLFATFGDDLLYVYQLDDPGWVAHRVDISVTADHAPRLGVGAFAQVSHQVIPLDGSENFVVVDKPKLYVADESGDAVILIDLLTYHVQRYIGVPESVTEHAKSWRLPEGSAYLVEDMSWDKDAELLRVLWRAAVPGEDGRLVRVRNNNWLTTLELYSDRWLSRVYEDKGMVGDAESGHFKGDPMGRVWAGNERFYVLVQEPEAEGITIQVYDNMAAYERFFRERERMIRDRIVMIGPTSEALHDNFRTPFFRDLQMPGVEIHANAAMTMLDRNFLTPPRDLGIPSWLLLGLLAIIAAFLPLRMSPLKALFMVVVMALFWIFLSYMVFMGLYLHDLLMVALFFASLVLVVEAFSHPLGLVIRKFIRKENMPTFKDTFTKSLKRMGLVLAVGAALWALLFGLKAAEVGFLSVVVRNYILELSKPVLALVLAAGVSTFYVAMTEGREKSKIKGMFSKYVNTEVVDDLLLNPDEIGLGGKRMELSVFFSDIRGFTSISERMDAEELVEFLNEYLTAMTEIVFEFGGTLDKFIGDAVMAIWGAPVSQSNHPERCVRAAVKMQEVLADMRKVWAERGMTETILIGCGVNTGECVVGNIGSERRMDYTVIGDHVNLAARLESITKQYAAGLIISEDTYIRVKDVIEGRYLDEIKVKGKTAPVKIFEVFSIRDDKRDFDPKSGLGKLNTPSPEEIAEIKAALHKAITGQEKPTAHK